MAISLRARLCAHGRQRLVIGDHAEFRLWAISGRYTEEIRKGLFPMGRRHTEAPGRAWVSWKTSAKKEQTREGRTAKAVERLSKGEERSVQFSQL